MGKLAKSFSRLKPIQAIVLGDFILDTYTKGNVLRISPEAPVPVLQVTENESRPGGAGNVVCNLLSLGAQVTAFGRVGEDAEGEHLRKLLINIGIDATGIEKETGYPTSSKNRLIANSQQIVRMDREISTPLSKDLEEKLLSKLSAVIGGSHILALSDYNKGFLSRSFLHQIISLARKHHVPVLVDPKGEDFSKYIGSTLIKPNQKEAYLASKISQDTALEKVAEELLRISKADHLLITRSEKGMSLFSKDGSSKDFPVKSKEVKDVTGAGDTVLAMLTFGVANGLPLEDAVQLANLAGSLAIEKLGCANITLNELAERLLQSDVENKIFSESHLYVLKEALKEKRFRIIGVDPKEVSMPLLCEHLHALKKSDPDAKILLYLEGKDQKISSFFSSLTEIDFVIIGTTNLFALHEALQADEMLLIEADQIKRVDNPISLLATLQSIAAKTHL